MDELADFYIPANWSVERASFLHPFDDRDDRIGTLSARSWHESGVCHRRSYPVSAEANDQASTTVDAGTYHYGHDADPEAMRLCNACEKHNISCSARSQKESKAQFDPCWREVEASPPSLHSIWPMQVDQPVLIQFHVFDRVTSKRIGDVYFAGGILDHAGIGILTGV
jgi:hypothetical protein